MLALSSLSRNSRYIGLFWVGVWFITSITSFILEKADHEQRSHKYFQRIYETQMAARNSGQKQTREEMQQQRDEQMKAFMEMKKEEFEDAKRDWRPLVSYTVNLARVGDALLGTDKCWEKLSLNKPADQRAQYLLDNMAPMHPWRWSAFVLIVLFGISVCILNFRVKSLDRLK
jgi:hypothetical protein